jgi:ABC-2 type transport system ATP-binding protein
LISGLLDGIILPVTFISLQNVRKMYRKSRICALDGLNLNVGKGSFFGLLGPNGCGKTTTIRIICGLLKPTSGSVHAAGVDVNSHPNQVKAHIGLIPHEIALYPSLTLQENLRYFGVLIGMSGQQLTDRIKQSVTVARLDKEIHRRIDTFSLGMRRRANFAVGILHEPDLLILDEPTVGVDPVSREVLHDNLRTLQDRGTTIFYTTHYMEEAEKLCTDVAIMDEGRIVQQNSPAALIRAVDGASDLGQVFMHLTGKSWSVNE